MKKITLLFLIILFSAILPGAYSQELDYDFSDFVGTWHGTISSESFQGYSDPITMTIEPDGFYTETSGHLMPSLYPNTQQCEFDLASNRMHW